MKRISGLALIAMFFAAPAAHTQEMFSAIPSVADEPPPRVQALFAGDGFDVVGVTPSDAIAAFQLAQDLEVTGLFDDATRAKLGAMVRALATVRGASAPEELTSVVEIQGDEAAVEALMAVLAGDREPARLVALSLLSSMHSTRSRASLGIVMHANDSSTVRLAATRALSGYGDAQSLYAIALASDDERDERVTRAMHDALDAALLPERPSTDALVSIAR